MYQWCLGIVHHTCTPYKESYWGFSAGQNETSSCIYKGRDVLRVNHIYHRFGLCCSEMESSVRQERLSRDLQSSASFNRTNLPEQTTTQSGPVHSVDHCETKTSQQCLSYDKVFQGSHFPGLAKSQDFSRISPDFSSDFF